LKEQRTNGEFHRADPGRRRHMQWLLVATVLLAITGLVALQLWLGRPHTNAAAYTHTLTRGLASLCILLALAGAVFAIWLFRLAAATRADRRWPPASMRTSSDVKIRYLTSADALVMQMRGGAVALALVSLALAGWGVWLLRSG
jgi:hypothetical protein